MIGSILKRDTFYFKKITCSVSENDTLRFKEYYGPFQVKKKIGNSGRKSYIILSSKGISP